MRYRWYAYAGIATLSIAALGLAAEGPSGRGGPRQGPGGPGGPMEMPRIPVMTVLDTNGDGELSAEEIAGASQALKKLDANGDGKLSRDELRPQFRGRGGPGRPGFAGGPPGMGGGPGGPGPFGGRSAAIETAPVPKDDAERRILKALREIEEKQGRMLNVPALDGRFLRVLAESIGAKTVVEFGTSNGVSAIWFSLALRKTGGKLITHEISADVAALARKNFETAGVAEIVTVVEGDAHQTASKLTGPIDLVFIDADKEGYLDYLQKTLPLVRPGGLITAHNMNPRMADQRFLKAITTDPNLETVLYTEGGGLSVSLKKR